MAFLVQTPGRVAGYPLPAHQGGSGRDGGLLGRRLEPAPAYPGIGFPHQLLVRPPLRPENFRVRAVFLGRPLDDGREVDVVPCRTAVRELVRHELAVEVIRVEPRADDAGPRRGVTTAEPGEHDDPEPVLQVFTLLGCAGVFLNEQVIDDEVRDAQTVNLLARA